MSQTYKQDVSRGDPTNNLKQDQISEVAEKSTGAEQKCKKQF